jgi:hypothetical protein
MYNTKRVVVATLAGVLFGFVCLGLASTGPDQLPLPVALQITTSRILIGVAIGVSCLSLGHWSVHGLVFGLLFSLPLAFSVLMAPENSQFSKTGMFFGTVLLGMIYGLLIEVITSLFFKARVYSTKSAVTPGAAPTQ